MTAIPVRPRLASHAAARRHIVGEEDIVVVHDLRSAELMQLTAREWRIVEHADGTRDEGGIFLALARSGLLRRRSEVRSLLERLHDAGLLVDGIEHSSKAAAIESERPIDPLPRYRLSCDGSGWCCRIYPAVIVLEAEARRFSLGTQATLKGRELTFASFTPIVGSSGAGVFSTPIVDGCCPFLAADSRCTLHSAGGAEAKPFGCRTYPSTFVDDGEAVRVSVVLECACAFEHADEEAAGSLVPVEASVRGDLPRALHVPSLPREIVLGEGATADRSSLIAWTQALRMVAPPDVARAFWALGIASAESLDPERACALVGEPPMPAPDELLRWARALARYARRFAEREASWRSPVDLVRASSMWVAEAAERLATPEGIEHVSTSAHAKDEELYFRAVVHGHHLVGELPLGLALRERGLRVWLARSLAPILERAHARGEPPLPGESTSRHPLAVVEALMRGHGLASYARALGPPSLGGELRDGGADPLAPER